MRQTRQPGQFVWEEIGRSFVARFGRLSASVSRRGRKGFNQVWRVDTVFGSRFAGREHTGVDDAILEAEALILKEAAVLPAKIETQAKDTLRRVYEE